MPVTDFGYQDAGRDFLAAGGHRILGDEPGLGKTRQSILAADKIGARDILVICMAVARVNWCREWERWQATLRTVDYVRTSKAFPQTSVVVTSYDHVTYKAVWAGAYAREWDLLILDEAHALKSPEAKRTRCIYGPRIDRQGGLAERADRVWLLTGTLAPNGAHELWTHFHALFPERIAT